MAVTLYSTYIDYNGDRTFVNVGNCSYVAACADIQCGISNCVYLNDSSETVTISGNFAYQYNCNCACDCNCGGAMA